MDDTRFDHLIKTLSTAGSRRALLGVLVALPGLESVIDSVAAGKRRKKGRKHGKDRRRKEQHKKPMLCRPESRATTCADTCGAVKNNCQQTIECGSCACEPPCGVCLTCEDGPNIPGECVPDPAQVGEACGAGQVCREDGRCTCDATSCAVCETCQEDGICSDPCDGEGCCAEGTCEPGNTLQACGIDGASCQVCADDEFCWNGRCVCGDVCADGCQFQTIQEAVEAVEAGATLRLCAETYAGVGIQQSLTLLGVGNSAEGTVLDGGGRSGVVVIAPGASVVVLQGLRITGGAKPRGGADGGGIYNSGGTLTLIHCTVTGNSAADAGGGIFNHGGHLTLRHTHVIENAAGFEGGGIHSAFETLTLEDCVISGNTARRGGNIFVRGGTAELIRTEVTDSAAQTHDGGAILNWGILRLIDSRVTASTAALRGGGIHNSGGTVTLTNSEVTDNTAATQGGGISNDRGTVSLTSSHVTENTAESGGGVYNDGGSVTLTDSTVEDNEPDNCAGDPVVGCSG